MAKAKKYKLLVPAAGFPAGEIVSGPAVEVLAANGKAVEVVDATDTIPVTAKKRKEEKAV